jgi:hypothetical protein
LAEACGDRFAFGVVVYDIVPFGDRLAAAVVESLEGRGAKELGGSDDLPEH